MNPLVRRPSAFLSGILLAGNLSAFISLEPGEQETPMTLPSTFFATAMVDEASAYHTSSDGDLWPAAWSDDGHLYLANGDGSGFNPGSGWRDIVVSRITSGHPDNRNLVGSKVSDDMGRVWSALMCADGLPAYNRKPTGISSRGGILWMAVQDLNRCGSNSFNDAPNATILKSADRGKTWTYDPTKPMFSGYEFTTMFFLDWGQDGADNYSDKEVENYFYVYGMDGNWRDSFNDSVPDPTQLYLARIRVGDDVQDIEKWQFWLGGLNGGAQAWSPGGWTDERKPVLVDTSRTVYGHTRIAQGSVTYNKPLDRFIYLSWSEYTFEFYEAPRPWGPWKKFLQKDFGPYKSPWTQSKNGGYATVMPSRYISADGTMMWFNSNTFAGPVTNYNFSLRQLTVTKHDPALTPQNSRSDANLAQTGESTTPFSLHNFNQGNPWALNDGVTNVNTDDWNDAIKSVSEWGYTWSRPYRMNKVEYVTGGSFSSGGWFSQDLRVQVRQNFVWKNVENVVISPSYPHDATANPFKTYTFSFSDTWGDGVRIIGENGGPQRFTSIAELKVFYH